MIFIKHYLHIFFIAVIKDNYDTLQLSPVEKVERYTSYTELPAEMAFFRQVLRTATTDYIACITERGNQSVVEQENAKATKSS